MVAALAGRIDLAPAQGLDRLMAEWIYAIHPPFRVSLLRGRV